MTSLIASENEMLSDEKVDQVQKSLIEKLTSKVSTLEEEKGCLQKEISLLRRENVILKDMVQSHGCWINRSLSTPKQSWKLKLSKVNYSNDEQYSSTLHQDLMNDMMHKCDFKESTPKKSLSLDSPPFAMSLKKAGQRTSRRGSHRRSESSNMYELSSDLREKNIECLEKKYGGKIKANNAARKIQQCYRHWVLNKSFLRMRASSGRKRSITMPEKHFEKLKKTSLVFYGPENPVMIIDDDNKFHTEKALPISPLTTIGKQETLAEVLNDSVDEAKKEVDLMKKNNNDEKSSSFVSQEVLDSGENIVIAVHKEDKVIDEESSDPLDDPDGKAFLTSEAPVDSTIDDSSHIESQYDIIDESQVLTVLGKEVETLSGSLVSVDTIHDDTPDGFAFLDDTQHYEPTFDKSMHKRQFRIGVNLFNWKPQIGIDYLIDNEHLQDDIKSIAEFLRKETTISKQKISEYFSNLRNEFSMKVLLEFAKSFEFVGKGVDEALRQFQSYFKLTGEAQTVERFLQVFSDRYVECNPDGICGNPDTILLLAFALAMLNTDLHNQNVKRRMTVEEFLKNLRGTNNGSDFDPNMLNDMYSRIQKNEFATGADHTTQLHQIENSFVGKIPNLAATHRQFVKLFTIEEVIDPNRKDKPHNRLAFLFNDLLILAKPRGKSGTYGSGHIFSCKASYSLLGKKVAEFSNEHYAHGVLLLQKIDGKSIASFSMKDENSKRSFVEELDEYIRETNGMENIRIALSKTNQLVFQNRRKDPNRCKSLFLSKNSLNSQDSGFYGMDKTETASLMNMRIGNSLEAEDAQVRTSSSTIMASSSMNDINKGESGEKYENLIRSGSSSSLDPAVLSDSNSNTTDNEKTNSSSTSQNRKSLFGQIKWKQSASKVISHETADSVSHA